MTSLAPSARRAACAAVDRDAALLTALSDRLHATPETAWQEHRSARACADAAVGTGLSVTCPAFGALQPSWARPG
jgi:metal-dependent amidase/aminoacylase/carboxypeptidase family protein